MKFHKVMKWSLFFVLLTSNALIAQNRKQLEQAAYHVINDLLASRLGPQYRAMFVIDVDSVSENADLYRYPVEDPYGILRHCFIFIGGREASEGNFVGVYKDGRILWRSDTTILGSLPKLFTAEDLNRSNQVDIVVESGMGWRSQLWIFNWDGHIGRRINAIDSSGESVLQSVSHSFLLFDANGDGILEIRDGNVKDGSQTWSWNGSEYGNWPDTPHLPSTTLWPANKIDITVYCSVTDSAKELIFNYTICSKPTSLQSVERFSIWGICDSIKQNSAPSTWETGYNSGRGFSWFEGKIVGYRGFILPRKSLSGFKTVASGICAITRYDAQGYNDVPDYQSMSLEDQRQAFIEDETVNSVHGFTIAPVNPPSPLVPSDFLDTLISYKHQCVALGWLTNGPEHEKDEDDDKADEGVVERLDRRLDKAKAALAKSDSVKARLELELFVKEVEQLYHQNKEEGERRGVPVLTSEGYALLKYNAEYLIERLPEGRKGHDR